MDYIKVATRRALDEVMQTPLFKELMGKLNRSIKHPNSITYSEILELGELINVEGNSKTAWRIYFNYKELLRKESQPSPHIKRTPRRSRKEIEDARKKIAKTATVEAKQTQVIIPAKQTFYDGYRFRSRLEARWAIVFNELGIKYEYEAEGYEMGELGGYLPDFYITTKDGASWFVEVKGNPNDTKGIDKALALNANPPRNARGCIIVNSINVCDPHNSSSQVELFAKSLIAKTSVMNFERALLKGKQARFEHGECG